MKITTIHCYVAHHMPENNKGGKKLPCKEK